MPDFDQTLSTWKQIVESETTGNFNPSRTYKGTSSPSANTHENVLETLEPQESPPEQPNVTKPKSPWSSYTIDGELGRGGMGVVYNARQTSLQRNIALKKSITTAGGQRFTNEAVVTGALQHPNIVTVYDLVKAPNGEIGMAMKLIDGDSWHNHLLNDWSGVKQLPEDRLNWHLEVLVKVCQAVAYAHKQGVLHNDLKPENVMLGAYGEVALMDWGCATGIPAFRNKSALPVLRGDKIASPFGTPCYMPPEQAMGHGKDIDTWTDTYLIGALLFRIVEGQPLRTDRDLQTVLKKAMAGEYLPLKRCQSFMLRDLCARALQANPVDRFQSVDDILTGLAKYQQTQASEKLAWEATALLEHNILKSKEPGHSTERVLLELGEAVYGFQQALVLWPDNQNAIEREEKARTSLIEYAITQLDLQLASAHIDQLKPGAAQNYCQQLLETAIAKREAVNKQAQRTRLLLMLAVGVVISGLLIGYAVVKAEQNKTESQRYIAMTRLQEIEKLSDIQLVQNQEQQQSELWPAVPSKADAMTKWIQQSEDLLADLSTHQTKLNKIVAETPKGEDGSLSFVNATKEWEHVTLQALVNGLLTLRDTELDQMKERLKFATTLEQATRADIQPLWTEAVESIKSSPLYNGLVITPQLGLIPLGADPKSGLWEFAHLQSGDLPKRDSNGTLVLAENPGIVLVLIPGGPFYMGAQRPGSNQADGGNIDPEATDIEQPVHQVRLGPFFIGKYEFTQGQWFRIMGNNPSAYLVGRMVGDPEKKAISIRNPVEQVTWNEAVETLRRYDLTLPTEAQWEFSNRAGTRTIFWSGDSPQSLQGTLNIADSYCQQNGGPGSWKYVTALNDGYVAHAPIGEFQANNFGLHDTTGNVWEWCLDRFGSYDNPTAPNDGRRLELTDDAPHVFRGGGFRAATVHARSADRYTQYAAEYQGYDVGFRASRPIRTSDNGE